MISASVQERYEAAEAARRLRDDRWRRADREAGLVKKAGEAQRLERCEGEDKALLQPTRGN
eukprot:gene6514-20_t